MYLEEKKRAHTKDHGVHIQVGLSINPNARKCGKKKKERTQGKKNCVASVNQAPLMKTYYASTQIGIESQLNFRE